MDLKIQEIILLADAVERINAITGTDDIGAVVNALTGLCWDEEAGDEISRYHESDPDEDFLITTKARNRDLTETDNQGEK
jgi:hypothetical protein